jgi:long-chain fatty acid transport protein
MLSAGVLVGDIEFDASATTPYPGGDGGQQGGPGPLLGVHYVHRLWDRPDSEYFDRVRLGISLLSISGAVLDPENDWSGRFEVQKLGLITLTAFPSIAVRIHDRFSIGAGATLTYGRMNYKVAVDLPDPIPGEGQVEFDGIDDFQAGATVSALWEPTDRTRVGAMWSQEVDLDLSGNVKFKGTGATANIVTKIPYAQAVRLSLLHEVTPHLWLAGNFRWEDWSSFEKQWVTVEDFKTQINRGWDDTFGGSLGGRWQFADRWALLAGVGYDSSPVTASDRTADMPVDRQVRVGIGAQYRWGESRNVGLNFSYANLGPAKIRSETLTGSYDDNQLFSVTLYLGFAKLPWSRAN